MSWFLIALGIASVSYGLVLARDGFSGSWLGGYGERYPIGFHFTRVAIPVGTVIFGLTNLVLGAAILIRDLFAVIAE